MTPGFHFPSEPLWLFPYHSPFLTSALLLQSSPVTHYYNLALIGTECDVLHTSSQGFAGDSVVLKKKKIHLPMQETQIRFLGQEDPLEEEMTIHSSVVAWKIPWTEEPGRL